MYFSKPALRYGQTICTKKQKQKTNPLHSIDVFLLKKKLITGGKKGQRFMIVKFFSWLPMQEKERKANC